jgi:hypothetical protein
MEVFYVFKIQINQKKNPFPKWKKNLKKKITSLTNIIILQHLFNIEFYYHCITFGHSTFGHGMFNVV